MSGSTLVPRVSGSALTKAGRETNRQLAKIEQEAIAYAAKVEAIGLVTAVGVRRLTRLSELEGQCIKMSPLGEARYEALINEATLTMREVISRMARS